MKNAEQTRNRKSAIKQTAIKRLSVFAICYSLFAVSISCLYAGFTGDFSQSGGAVYDGTSNDSGQDVAVDTITIGGPYTYVVGYSSIGVNINDYFTIKYDAAGNVLSSATFNGGNNDGGYDIAVDNSGNVYVTGWSNNGTNDDCVTIKYNSSLVFQSSAAFNWGYNDSGDGIAVDNSGNVYVTGYSYNGTNLDCVTIKYNSSLVFQSTAVFNSGYDDRGDGIAVDNSGNVYVTGYSYNGTNYDCVTIKYNSSLVFQSSAAFNGGSDDWGFGIAVDNSGNVYVTGRSDNGTNDDCVTIKYNSSLVFQSSVVFNGGGADSGKGIAVDNSGNVYVTGYSNNGTNNDYVTIKYNSSLVFQSSAAFNGGSGDVGSDIAVDNSGNVYVTGQSNNGTNWDYCTIRYQLPDAPPSAGTISGGVTYSGPLSGNYAIVIATIAIATPPSIAGGIVFSTMNASGNFTASELPVPNTFYILAFRDVNGNGNPDVDREPWNVNVGLVNPALIYMPSAQNVDVGNITLYDWGRISGSITKTSTQTGVILIIASGTATTDPNFGSWVLMPSTNIAVGNYTVAVATAWNPVKITAFIDNYSSLNGNLDPGEHYYESNATFTVTAGGITPLNIVISSPVAPTAPAAPTGFAGTSPATTSIIWTWTDNSSDETGFRVKTSTGGTIKSLAEDATSWTETDLSVNTQYTRYVEVYNSTGTNSSSTASKYTLANPPSGTQITQISSTTITLNWSSDNPSGTRYGILRSLDSGFTSPTTLKAFSDNYTSTSYLASDLLPLTSYWFKVNAFNGDELATAFDTTISTRTRPALPARIANLYAWTGYYPGQVYLGWSAPVGAAYYILKYSTNPITNSTQFDNATTYTQNWTPLPAGWWEGTKIIEGLTAGQLYYFNIVAVNADGVVSAISNTFSCKAKEGLFISGKITDISGNGVSGVSVKLSTTTDGTTIQEVTTNANGAYKFTNLTTSSYIIKPTSTDYRFSPKDKYIWRLYYSWDYQDFVAAPVGVVGTISGIIKDTATLTGIQGANVYLYNYTSYMYAGSVTTDATGYYQLTELPIDKYQIEVSSSGYIRSVYSGKTSLWAGDAVIVSSGVTTTVNFSLSKTSSISGKVVDQNGDAYPEGFRFYLNAHKEDWSTTRGWAYTDYNYSGNYKIEGLTAGDYTIWMYHYTPDWEFVRAVYYSTTTEYGVSDWRDASYINVPASTDTTNMNFVVWRDTIAPSGRFVINYATATTTKSKYVKLSLSLTDVSPSGVQKIALSNDGENYTHWKDYNATQRWSLSESTGTKTVYLKAKDKAGNFAVFTDDIDYTGEFIPPAVSTTPQVTGGAVKYDPNTGQMMLIMSRSALERKVDVSVPLSYQADKVWAIYKDVEYLLSESYENNIYTYSGTLTIPQGNYMETNDIIIKIITKDGEVIEFVYGTVELVDPSGYVFNSDNGEKIEGATVTLYWYNPATSQFEQADQSKVSYDPTINPQSTSDDGYYGWDVQAGNYYVKVTADWYNDKQSSVVSVPPEVTDLHVSMLPQDTTAPVIVDFAINGSSWNAVTNSRSVTLALTVTDELSGANKMWISNDSYTSGGSWEKINTTKNWTLSEGEGIKTVYLKVKDKCGNTTQKSAKIRLSTTADNLENVKVYPNPYKPGATGADAKFSDPQEGTGVVFDRLTAKANIKVYNIAGELVAELD
ncbi:MAG: carboxypeptidase regulatory-like domain-containing protein, partial [Elusimicrobiota bacterium]